MSAEKPKILIVDDEDLNIEFLKALLRKKGFEIVTADGGSKALEMINSNKPDLILLDAMMPSPDGFEVCRQLRQNSKTKLLPIIMVTALQSEEDEEKALTAGADDFLSKPINTFELYSRIRSLLRIKLLNDELIEIQALRDSLTQMIIHDLKNPLTGIMGCCELLMLMKDSMSSDQAVLVKKIEDNTAVIANMTNEILDVSRLEENKLQLKRSSFSIEEVFKANVNEFQVMLKKHGVECEIESNSGLPEITADRDIFNRIIANLLFNAIKHSIHRGKIQLKAEKKSNRFDFAVIDQGEGIPAEYLEKIFEKFAQAEMKQKGLKTDRGLGLTFCKMAIEAHGGKIWAESEVGKGSSFRFYIPDAEIN